MVKRIELGGFGGGWLERPVGRPLPGSAELLRDARRDFDHARVHQRVGLLGDDVAPVGERDQERVDREVGDQLQPDEHKRLLPGLGVGVGVKSVVSGKG